MKKRLIRWTGAALALALALAPAAGAVDKGRVAALGALLTVQTAVRQALPESAGASDPAGTVTWENLERRVRSANLTAQALQENAGAIEAIDYEKMTNDLRDQLNGLARQEYALRTISSQISGAGGGETTSDLLSAAVALAAAQAQSAVAADSLQSAYQTLRATFDDLKDGTIQQDNADLVRQLESGVDQVVAGSQTLYINLISLERTLDDGRRGLAAIDRNLEQLRLRQTLGQVSEKAVLDLEQTRRDTAAQLSALESSITSLKLQLQQLMGETPDGVLTLSPLPEVSDRRLDALDCEADLEIAKAASWTLYSAKLTLDDAEEDWKDAKSDYPSLNNYHRQMAEHTWNAAQLTYQSTVESFETSFRALYQSIPSKRQAVESAASALALSEQSLEIAKTRYAAGTVSAFAVKDAEDEAAAAGSTLESAKLDLFTAYHDYQNAVRYGILD